MKSFDQLISAAWLREHLHDTDIRIFDATYHMPAAARNASKEFEEKHIPGAAFFDIDVVADASASLPHMLPTADHFARAVQSMGMTSNAFGIIYDVHGLMSAARLWWMFRVFGHDRVAVLDGGLPAWIANGGEIESGPSRAIPATSGSFKAQYRPELVCSRDDVLAAVQTESATILDARSSARFFAQAPEPRPGVRQGHIPGSISIPYTELLDEHGLFRNTVDVMQKFSQAPIGSNSRIITSCGSGVTACVLALGLAEIGRGDVAVYDGSWNEWGADQQCPIETA